MIADVMHWVHVELSADGYRVLLGSELKDTKPLLVGAFGLGDRDAAFSFAASLKSKLKEFAEDARYDGAMAEREGRYDDEGESCEEGTSDRASMRVSMNTQQFRKVKGRDGAEHLVCKLDSPFGVSGELSVACNRIDGLFTEERICVDLTLVEPIVLSLDESAALLGMVGALGAAAEERAAEEAKGRN